MLRDGIYELRVVHTGQQYRILYFFHQRKAVVLTHSFQKKTQMVPDRDIDLALKRRIDFLSNPSAHTFKQTNEE